PAAGPPSPVGTVPVRRTTPSECAQPSAHSNPAPPPGVPIAGAAPSPSRRAAPSARPTPRPGRFPPSPTRARRRRGRVRRSGRRSAGGRRSARAPPPTPGSDARSPSTPPPSVGRSCPLPVDQVEQLQFHLAGAAAEAGQFQALGLAAQVAVRLGHAADRPAQVTQHLPEADRLPIDLPPGRGLVGGEELLRLADAAQADAVLAEAPGAD